MTGARTRRSRPMDAETRDHLADVRRRRRGIATPGERDRAAADQAVELWNKTYPPGIMVDVLRDDGAVFQTNTRSIAWRVCDHAVVLVDGISGGYLLDRVTPRPTTIVAGCSHEAWLDSVDLERRPIRTCTRCGFRLLVMNLNTEDIAELVDMIQGKIRWYGNRTSSITSSRRANAIHRYSNLLERVKEIRRG